jgi:hypothetical protein
MGRHMAGVEFPKVALSPRNLERRPASAEFRPGAAHRVRSGELEAPDSPAINQVDAKSHRRAETNAEATLNSRKIEERFARNPLDEMATLVQGLTYGEMIEFSEAMWKVRAEGSDVTLETLPAVLHRWSTSRHR